MNDQVGRVWIISILLLCTGSNTEAQIHGLQYWDHWQLGDTVSVNFPDGQTGTAQYDTGMLHRGVTRLTICDPVTGTIMFSWDGDKIRDSTNLLIPNGANSGGFTDHAGWIAHPGSGDIDYLFVSVFGLPAGWRCTTVHRDMGILPSEVNVPLGPYESHMALAAISDPNGTTTWAVTHDMQSDAFRSYRITALSGLDTVPTVQHIGPTLNNFQYGCSMRVSPNNRKLALIGAAGMPNVVTILNVDPTNGMFSDPVEVPFTHEIHDQEFSPSSEFLYVIGGQPKNLITQIDLAAGDSAAILQSAVVLPFDTNRFKDPPRLGTDGRLYVGMVVGFGPDDRYARILEPDQPGLACNTDTAGLVFPNPSSLPFAWNYWPFTPNYLSTAEYQAQANSFHVWPVPSGDDVNIDLGFMPDRMSVDWIDATGRIVKTQAWPMHSSTATLDRGSLPSGAYIIEVRPENNTPRRAKVMLE